MKCIGVHFTKSICIVITDKDSHCGKCKYLNLKPSLRGTSNAQLLNLVCSDWFRNSEKYAVI